ncbi:MAG: DUF1232 domain-containing protein [Bacteroidetes bacterium]|nr:DUF1232 domain-containing protein [Bacteroidota bacterium]MBL6962905.1 DUF1232 domain-containing protein [Bacteroidota bacterium]
MDEQKQDFYQAMRKNIGDFLKSDKSREYKWREYLLLVPDMFHLLIRLSLDKRVNVKDKAILGIAIAYFVSPIDLIPEFFLGPLGYIDDLAVAAYALNKILSSTDSAVINEHWAGEEDIFIKTKEIIQKADDMLGSGLVNKIKKMVD